MQGVHACDGGPCCGFLLLSGCFQVITRTNLNSGLRDVQDGNIRGCEQSALRGLYARFCKSRRNTHHLHAAKHRRLFGRWKQSYHFEGSPWLVFFLISRRMDRDQRHEIFTVFISCPGDRSHMTRAFDTNASVECSKNLAPICSASSAFTKQYAFGGVCSLLDGPHVWDGSLLK